MKNKIAIAALAILLASCGKTEKVEGVKGPRGDKGEKGDTGETQVVYQTPIPVPVPTVTVTAQPIPQPSPIINNPPTIPYPPIIVVGQPWPNCESGSDSRCRSGNILVCACIDTFWQTISVNVHYRDRLRIKNDGPCFTGPLTQADYWNDCWGKPQPQPIPLPQPNRC